MTFYDIFIRFALYSFIGWVFECLYCPFLDGEIANRGFLKGPYCPVYGIASVAVIYALKSFDNVAAIFFMGVLISGSIEYLTGWILETCFHAKWWDYSQMPFNIKGRVFLLGLTVFGAVSVIGIKILEPLTVKLLSALPRESLIFITGALCAIISLDLITTLIRLLNPRKQNSFTDTASARFKAARESSKPIITIQRLVDNVVYGGRRGK